MALAWLVLRCNVACVGGDYCWIVVLFGWENIPSLQNSLQKSVKIVRIALFFIGTRRLESSNQIYWTNSTALFSASRQVKRKLKGHGSQEREGKTMLSPTFAWSLFLVKFLLKFIPRDEKSHREGCFPPEPTKITMMVYRVLEGLAKVVPQKIPPVANQDGRGMCCTPEWSRREASEHWI